MNYLTNESTGDFFVVCTPKINENICNLLFFLRKMTSYSCFSGTHRQNKECALAHSCAERGRLRHITSSREYPRFAGADPAHPPGGFSSYRKQSFLYDEKGAALSRRPTITITTTFYHSISYTFYRFHMDRDHLDIFFYLLQPEPFWGP